MRALTRLEARLMGLTPSQASVSSSVLRGDKVHPQYYRKGVANSFELVGMRRPAGLDFFIGARAKALGLGFRSKDVATGNDAPRGGAQGDWIQLTPSGKAKAKRRLA